MSKFYTNVNQEDFNLTVKFLGNFCAANIEEASHAYIDLEAYIFAGTQFNFATHNFKHNFLINKFNQLLTELAVAETEYSFLAIDLQDVKSCGSKELFMWSFNSHKFAQSKGTDTDAAGEVQKLEKLLGPNEIGSFKARREANVALYMHVIRNSQAFSRVCFSRINPIIKSEIKFGLDIAEEEYLEKLIRESESVNCFLVEYYLASPLLNMLKNAFEPGVLESLKLKASIISSSKKLNPFILLFIRNLFTYMEVSEAKIENGNFVLLVNDLDSLAQIPYIETDKPIFTVDLSQPNTPNFGYMLLKDDGFSQVYSYAKKRKSELNLNTICRSFVGGLVYFACKRRFDQQIANNYMEDYFKALAASSKKGLEDFSAPIKMLADKLQPN